MLQQGFLKQPDGQFWIDPVKNTNRVLDQLSVADFEGVVIDGPRHLPLDRDVWPIVACRRCSQETGEAVSFTKFALLVAIDPDTDQVWAGHAYARRVPDRSLLPEGARSPLTVFEDEDPEDEEGREDILDDEGPELLTEDDLSPEELAAQGDEEVPEGATEEPVYGVVYFIPHTLDLQAQLRLPQRFGRYVVYLVLQGIVSNPVHLSVGKAPDAYHDPEVAKFLASRRDALPPPQVLPSLGPGACYGEGTTDAPDPPAGLGVTLAIDEVITRGRPVSLRGSFRLPVHPHLRAAREGQPPADVGVLGATAVVLVTLVLTGSVYGGPMTVGLQLPTQDGLDGEEPVATGRFVVDLAASRRLHDVPAQVYHLHAFAGGKLRASASFEVVEA